MPNQCEPHINIKQTVLAVFFLFVSFGFVAIPVFSLHSVRAIGETQEEVQLIGKQATAAALATPSAIVADQSEYFFPYPGILPDHPLYWIKMVRDRLWLWLARSPVQKIERLLLYADKRLGAGEALINNDKKDLGVTTITKAEKYLEKAFLKMAQLPDGSEKESLKTQLLQSAEAHRQVLNKLEDKVPDSLQQIFDEARQKPQTALD